MRFWWVKWAFFAVVGLVGVNVSPEWGFSTLAVGSLGYLTATSWMRRQARARGEEFK